MRLLPPLLALCALSLSLCDLGTARRPPASVPQPLVRHKRQEADVESEDYVADYAGNNNNENDVNNNNDDDDDSPKPMDEPKDNFHEDDFGDMNMDRGTNDLNEDKFGADIDNLDNSMPQETETDKKETEEKRSEESKPKKKAKKHKYLKKTLDFLKRVLDPNKLMQNAYVTEMLRRFSHQEDPSYESKESSSEEVHTPRPVKKRRGRPKKKDKIPPGITGMIRKGVMSLTQMELDKRKLRRRVRLIRRLARKAKRPLKTAVKIFLSSRNQGMGGYGGGGGGGFDNNNY